jgi:DNA-binding response OmpR family regulator
MRSPNTRIVLLIEDNLESKTLTGLALRRYGWEVMEAGSLAEARALVGTRNPDIVLLDCRLPDGDGLELVRQWATHETMKEVPIVVLTGFSARQDLEAALLAGADAFLVKPCPNAVLTAQLERVLRSGRTSQSLRVVRRPQ